MSIVDKDPIVKKTGSYGRVTLVSHTQVGRELQQQRRGVIPSFAEVVLFFDSIPGYGYYNTQYQQAEAQQRLWGLTEGILDRGIVDEEEFTGFVRGNKRNSVRLASLLASLETSYAQKRFGTDEPYVFGQYSADLLEVVPTRLAADILSASSNSEHARAVNAGQSDILRGDQTSDPQKTAIEALVLLPQQIRRSILEEMSRRKPGTEGPAYRLFSLMGSNFRFYHSGYSGAQFIERNLPEDQAEAKIEEVADEIRDLTPVLRNARRGFFDIRRIVNL